MDNLILPATQLTPSIHFDYSAHALSMRGESYPENVAAFYGPILASLREYLSGAVQSRAVINVELELTYVNSSSTKSLQQFLAMLDAAARSGAKVTVRWIAVEDDESMNELGHDLLIDKHWLAFKIEKGQVAQ